jgi:hypothetical protein
MPVEESDPDQCHHAFHLQLLFEVEEHLSKKPHLQMFQSEILLLLFLADPWRYL